MRRLSALRQGLISVDRIKDALVTAQGDLFLTACYLDVRPGELDSYIRASDEIQGFVAAIDTVKKNADYDRLSKDQFEDQLDRLTKAYRIDALEVIHELATMPFDSAAMADVKLKAAVQLKGSNLETKDDGGHSLVLAELNQLYQQSAPRIRSIRAVQVEYEDS
jgi:hypothetical protein